MAPWDDVLFDRVMQDVKFAAEFAASVKPKKPKPPSYPPPPELLAQARRHVAPPDTEEKKTPTRAQTTRHVAPPDTDENLKTPTMPRKAYEKKTPTMPLAKKLPRKAYEKKTPTMPGKAYDAHDATGQQDAQEGL